MPTSFAQGTSSPRLQIGLPVYNGARFIGSALESLTQQSFRDFSLLISDNASTDDTQRICLEFCAADSRLTYIRQGKNLGAAGNWNYVVTQATAPYFKWSSANDVCAPTMLEQCIHALDADETAVLCQGRTALMDEDTGESRPYSNDMALLHAQPSKRLATMLSSLELNNGQSGVIRLSALRKTGLDRPYPGGDIPLMAELALQGCFVVLPDTLLYRRLGPSTFSELLDAEQSVAFYGALGVNTRLSYELNIHIDTLRAILKSDLDFKERLLSLKYGFQALYWNRRKRWSEFKSSIATTAQGR